MVYSHEKCNTSYKEECKSKKHEISLTVCRFPHTLKVLLSVQSMSYVYSTRVVCTSRTQYVVHKKKIMGGGWRPREVQLRCSSSLR